MDNQNIFIENERCKFFPYIKNIKKLNYIKMEIKTILNDIYRFAIKIDKLCSKRRIRGYNKSVKNLS